MKKKSTFHKSAFVILLFVFTHLWSQAQTGTTWTAQTSAADNNWLSVTYGNGLFVAVSSNGTNRVMTSPNGITWTSRNATASNSWGGVAYGNGIFVAVGNSGTNRVMTSPDGITWTSRASAAETNAWNTVTYGNGIFVAVAGSGTGNRVMTSPDGINWTIRTSAADNNWRSVVYGNGIFVAVSQTGTGNRVMTSPDGITWTSRTSAADNGWRNVTFGNGVFVAVANTTSAPALGTDRVMTSSDGITWTLRSSIDHAWAGVTFGNGLFVATANSNSVVVPAGNRVMTSPDGINWTSRATPAENSWNFITYSNGIFVAVASTGTGNRIMTSGTLITLPITLIAFTGIKNNEGNLLSWTTASEQGNKYFEIERSTNGISFEKAGVVRGNGTTSSIHNYIFLDKNPSSQKSYYRLKQVDLDGKFEYSKIISVNNQPGQSYHVLQNPVKERLIISTPSRFPDKTTVQLLDISGRIMPFSFQQTGNRISGTLNGIHAGLYIVKVIDGTEVFSIKILKE
jgi:hypothetical protein